MAGSVIRVDKNGIPPLDNMGIAQDPNNIMHDAVWARGIRNAFRASWDVLSNRYFIAEVGGNNWATAMEDLHLGKAGANYGWPYCEGRCNNPNFPLCNCSQHDDPIFTYSHEGKSACIIGGKVYRGSQFPSRYYGAYFFGDYVKDTISFLTFDTTGLRVWNEGEKRRKKPASNKI